jgi:hypothetical protein
MRHCSHGSMLLLGNKFALGASDGPGVVIYCLWSLSENRPGYGAALLSTTVGVEHVRVGSSSRPWPVAKRGADTVLPLFCRFRNHIYQASAAACSDLAWRPLDWARQDRTAAKEDHGQDESGVASGHSLHREYG